MARRKLLPVPEPTGSEAVTRALPKDPHLAPGGDFRAHSAAEGIYNRIQNAGPDGWLWKKIQKSGRLLYDASGKTLKFIRLLAVGYVLLAVIGVIGCVVDGRFCDNYISLLGALLPFGK